MWTNARGGTTSASVGTGPVRGYSTTSEAIATTSAHTATSSPIRRRGLKGLRGRVGSTQNQRHSAAKDGTSRIHPARIVMGALVDH